MDISLPELEALIEKIVRRVLAEKPGIHLQNNAEKKVTTQQLMHELQVSRQTLNNWRKSARIGPLLEKYAEKTTRGWYYDLEGIKSVIEQYGVFFGANRDYAYKEVTNDAMRKKENDRYYRINWKVMEGKQITKEEEEFYRAQCQIRGAHCLLDRYEDL